MIASDTCRICIKGVFSFETSRSAARMPSSMRSFGALMSTSSNKPSLNDTKSRLKRKMPPTDVELDTVHSRYRPANVRSGVWIFSQSGWMAEMFLTPSST